MQIRAIIENVAIQRAYAILNMMILFLTLSFLALGSTGNLVMQSVASMFILLGLSMCLGEIFMVINLVDKSNLLGRILNRLAYANLLAMLLAYLLVTMVTYLASFYIYGEASMHLNGLIASIGITGYSVLGICISFIAYRMFGDTTVWNSSNTSS